MKTQLHRVGLFFLILASWQSTFNANPLFESDEILDVVLTAPISQVYRQKNDAKRLWQTGTWAYTDNNGTIEKLDVSIRTRGIFRRENCKRPPLRLNFKKDQVKATLFQGQDKIKLVSPCKASTLAQQQLLLEYLAYRSLSILTDNSMRTRMLRLKHVDSGNKKTWTHYAFLLEPESDIAERLGLKVKHVPRLHSSQHNKTHTALIELFQLMIANNDYSVLAGPEGKDCCHNVEVLSPIDTDQNQSEQNLVLIPYDFDSSGLVNARYALPPEKLPIKSVRTRYYRGRCQKLETINTSIAHILSKKPEILELFQNNTLLNNRTKNKNIKYLREYFQLLESPKGIESKIIGNCRGKI